MPYCVPALPEQSAKRNCHMIGQVSVPSLVHIPTIPQCISYGCNNRSDDVSKGISFKSAAKESQVVENLDCPVAFGPPAIASQ